MISIISYILVEVVSANILNPLLSLIEGPVSSI